MIGSNSQKSFSNKIYTMRDLKKQNTYQQRTYVDRGKHVKISQSQQSSNSQLKKLRRPFNNREHESRKSNKRSGHGEYKMTNLGASLKKSEVNSFLRSSFERSDEGAAANSKLHNSMNKSAGEDKPSPNADRQRTKAG